MKDDDGLKTVAGANGQSGVCNRDRFFDAAATETKLDDVAVFGIAARGIQRCIVSRRLVIAHHQNVVRNRRQRDRVSACLAGPRLSRRDSRIVHARRPRRSRASWGALCAKGLEHAFEKLLSVLARRSGLLLLAGLGQGGFWPWRGCCLIGLAAGLCVDSRRRA